MILIYGKCNHFWRRRNPVPRHPPYMVDERYMQMPEVGKFCRPCIERINKLDSGMMMESGHDGTVLSAVLSIRKRASELEAATGIDARQIEAEVAAGITPGEWGMRHGLAPMFFYEPDEGDTERA